MNNRLFNWLQSIKNKPEFYSNNITQLQPLAQQIQPIQLNKEEQIVNNPDIGKQNEKVNLGTRLSNALFGVQTSQPQINSFINDENGNVQISSGVNTSPRQGGLLRDIASGFNENMHNNFQLDNLNDKITDNGRNKGIAFRVGEGIGTAAKFSNSPLGRMSITAAAIGAFGGSPLEMAAYGAKAGAGNQQNVMTVSYTHLTLPTKLEV